MSIITILSKRLIRFFSDLKKKKIVKPVVVLVYFVGIKGCYFDNRKISLICGNILNKKEKETAVRG